MTCTNGVTKDLNRLVNTIKLLNEYVNTSINDHDASFGKIILNLGTEHAGEIQSKLGRLASVWDGLKVGFEKN